MSHLVQERLHTALERLREEFATPNLGVADCLVRVLGGLVLTALAADGSIGWWGFVGLPSVATGVAWVCPAYKMLGISTASRFARDWSR
jgi:hypothetical protein